MRLLRLYIHDHRVLRDLDLRFDPGAPSQAAGRTHYHLDFLVGVNGTGKSTVLRLLWRILGGLRVSSDELHDMRFILEYYLENTEQKVRIANIYPDEEGTLRPLERYFVCTAPALDLPYEVESPDEAHLKDAVEDSLLPSTIAYTTGDEGIWLAYDEADPLQSSSTEAIEGLSATDRTIQELPGWTAVRTDAPQGAAVRLRFVWQGQLPLVALCGLLQHSTMPDPSPLADVLKVVDGIEDQTTAEGPTRYLAGFSLQFDLSYSSSNERNDLWQLLGQHASRAIRSGGKVLLVFQPERYAEVLAENSGALPLFERLADWQKRERPLLAKANLFLERMPKEKDQDGNPIQPPLHTWEWLSDGERSFIGRMCLFMLFGDVESLILLDEPEVHFNDYWKRHIVSMMDKVFEGKAKPHKSHVLIATHSSIALSDVPSEDVLILERPGLLTHTSRQPDIQTFGADPSDIMVHVFGAPHAMGEAGVEEIEGWLQGVYEEPADKRREYLKQRLDKVSPGYWAYRIRREMVGLSRQ